MSTRPDPDHPVSTRPDPDHVATAEELQRWYWVKSELVDMARRCGVRSHGSKVEPTEPGVRRRWRASGRAGIVPGGAPC